jgi:hypothetical protein
MLEFNQPSLKKFIYIPSKCIINDWAIKEMIAYQIIMMIIISVIILYGLLNKNFDIFIFLTKSICILQDRKNIYNTYAFK